MKNHKNTEITPHQALTFVLALMLITAVWVIHIQNNTLERYREFLLMPANLKGYNAYFRNENIEHVQSKYHRLFNDRIQHSNDSVNWAYDETNH